ncbi:MAG: hypothetical protein B6U89_01750 [Desulfurococcales archaeon ex4484_58]|nr:MAG: hypothetical protein B6U89_01750 [Desulfurococcales archaeon ex4484_58]
MTINVSVKPLMLLILTLTVYLIVFYPIIILWYNYMIMELYNYLMITPIVLLIIYISVIKKTSFIPNIKQYTIFTLLYSTGFTLIFLSTIEQNYADQLAIMGMVLIIHSIIIFFSNKNYVKKALLITPAILVLTPLPSGFVFNFSAYLTRVLLTLSIPLARFLGTNLNVTETSGLVVVNVLHGDKYVPFNIAPVCSGVIGLFSVLATTPLVVYASLTGTKSLIRRILSGVIGVSLLAVFMFLANVIRLTAVFYFTSLYGLEVGYGIFHYTPEIVLIIPIVLLVVKVIEKISGNINIFTYKREKNQENNNDSKPKYLALIPLILILPISIPILKTTYSTPPIIFTNTYNGPIMIFNLTSGEKEYYIPNNFLNTNIEYYGRVPSFEKELSPTTRVHIYRGILKGYKILDVYLEYSQQPSGIHIWELCLWWQNISIYSVETEVFELPYEKYKFVVRKIRYGTELFDGFLIYWRDKVYTNHGIEYYRVTVMLNTDRGKITDKDIEFVRKFTYQIWIRGAEASYGRYAKVSGFTLEYLVVTYGTIIAVSIIFFIIGEEKHGKLGRFLRKIMEIKQRDKK